MSNQLEIENVCSDYSCMRDTSMELKKRPPPIKTPQSCVEHRIDGIVTPKAPRCDIFSPNYITSESDSHHKNKETIHEKKQFMMKKEKQMFDK
jgi:hypothetical protein